METLTIEAFDELGNSFIETDDEIKALNRQIEALQEKKATLGAKLITIFQERQIKTQAFAKGKITISQRASVKFPLHDPEKKREVFDYIRKNHGEEVLENLLSIHHQSFNSLYKEDRESAAKKQDIEWSLAGLSETIDYVPAIRRS